MSVRPWPELREEDRWLTAAIEEDLRTGEMSPEQMRERAGELREQAASSDIDGVREASLALAERYEQAAASRLATR